MTQTRIRTWADELLHVCGSGDEPNDAKVSGVVMDDGPTVRHMPDTDRQSDTCRTRTDGPTHAEDAIMVHDAG